MYFILEEMSAEVEEMDDGVGFSLLIVGVFQWIIAGVVFPKAI